MRLGHFVKEPVGSVLFFDNVCQVFQLDEIINSAAKFIGGNMCVSLARST